MNFSKNYINNTNNAHDHSKNHFDHRYNNNEQLNIANDGYNRDSQFAHSSNNGLDLSINKNPNNYEQTGNKIPITVDELVNNVKDKLVRFDQLKKATDALPSYNPYVDSIICNTSDGKTIQVPKEIQIRAINLHKSEKQRPITHNKNLSNEPQPVQSCNINDKAQLFVPNENRLNEYNQQLPSKQLIQDLASNDGKLEKKIIQPIENKQKYDYYNNHTSNNPVYNNPVNNNLIYNRPEYDDYEDMDDDIYSKNNFKIKEDNKSTLYFFVIGVVFFMIGYHFYKIKKLK